MRARARPIRLLAACALVVACGSGPYPLGRLDAVGGAGSDAGGDASPAPPVDADGGDRCAVPAPARHYTFDGTGAEVVDARGGPPGRILGGAALDGSGVLHLRGGEDYVDLPNGILAGLEEVSVAVWVRRLGGPAYTRVFDFGTGSLGEDPPLGAAAVGRSYLALASGTGHVPPGLAVLMSDDGAPNEVVALSDVDLDDRMQLAVVVVARDTLALYSGAEVVARVPRAVPLAAIVDHNAWLGRSQYAADPHVEAELADLRIYDRALADCAVRALADAGPDPR